MNEGYLSVKDFAESAGVSTQYIYKILGTHLKPYKKKIQKKTYIDAAAVELVKNGFSTPATEETNQDATARVKPLQPNQPTDQPTDATEKFTQQKAESSGEVEALKMLIDELKKDKEQLQKDKEYLKQESLKWQQLLADERNKVKLLETAAAPIEKTEVVYRQVEQEKIQELPQTFGEKIKWLFGKK